MDPKLLTQLAIIVELGSVTKAARKLNVTQPTLSRSIKIMEDRVGGPLLRRERFGVSPTEIGRRLAEEGRRILYRTETAQTMINEWKHGLAGELRVGVGPMLAATLMGEFFAELMNAPPGYSLKLHSETAARVTKRLKDEELDVAIIPFELNVAEEGLFRELLFQDRLAVFVGENDPLARTKQVEPKALAPYQWIAVGETSGLFDLTRETLDRIGLPGVAPTIENSGDVTMTFRMLESAKTCSLLPLMQLLPYLARYRVAPVDLNMKLQTRNVAFWTTQASRDRPEVLDFLTRLQRFLSDRFSPQSLPEPEM
ncbi:MAG: hypothetical protein CMF26_02110 [Kiloniella sp.]|nr:hypothetical protein [Kiloniella sp.]